jgi:hypothetical protein
MCNYGSGNFACDLALRSFEDRLGKLLTMLGSNKPKIKENPTIFLVVNPINLYEANVVVKEYLNAIKDIIQKDKKKISDRIVLSIKIVDWLEEDAWLITSGEHLVFSPGA